MIAPQSRAFIFARLGLAGALINAWAPFSYIVLLALLIAPFASVYLMHKWPERHEPESPMAKYRKEVPFED